MSLPLGTRTFELMRGSVTLLQFRQLILFQDEPVHVLEKQELCITIITCQSVLQEGQN